MFNTEAERKAFFDEAFTRPTDRVPYLVPESIRKASEHIVMAYGIRGICDPMYIANVIAMHTGQGDGQGNFIKKS